MKTINEQINPKFVIQARKLAKYTRLLHGILPMECQDHIKVANIRNQNLMLITDSPVWTTRLRQLSPQILQFIRDNHSSIDYGLNKEPIIHHVQISTRFNVASDSSPTSASGESHHKPQISEKTAELLTQSASSITHQKLKTALLKIASHVNRQSKSK